MLSRGKRILELALQKGSSQKRRKISDSRKVQDWLKNVSPQSECSQLPPSDGEAKQTENDQQGVNQNLIGSQNNNQLAKQSEKSEQLPQQTENDNHEVQQTANNSVQESKQIGEEADVASILAELPHGHASGEPCEKGDISLVQLAKQSAKREQWSENSNQEVLQTSHNAAQEAKQTEDAGVSRILTELPHGHESGELCEKGDINVSLKQLAKQSENSEQWAQQTENSNQETQQTANIVAQEGEHIGEVADVSSILAELPHGHACGEPGAESDISLVQDLSLEFSLINELLEDDDVAQIDINVNDSDLLFPADAIPVQQETEISTASDNAGRKSDESSTKKRQTTQKRRLEGLEYQGYSRGQDKKVRHETVRSPRMIQPRCGHISIEPKSDRTHLCALINDTVRENHCREFWKLPSWEAKAAYIRGLVDSKKPQKRRFGNNENDYKKQESHDCYLKTLQGTKVLVCQKMFRSTFNIGESMFRKWIRDEALHANKDTDDNIEASVEEDENVPMLTAHKARRLNANEWLEELPKVPSHYCRSSSKKIYVESTFRSVRHMHQVYSQWCAEKQKDPVCHTVFVEILEENNIAIHHPRKDQCDTCYEYKVGNLDEDEYQEHIEKKNEARAAKENAKDKCSDEHLVITMDLQSILLAPKLRASSVYYKQKLQIHNFTVYALNDQNVTLYVWDEANGGVSANEFTSCIIDYLECNKNYKNVTLISDGCNYQNRNKCLSSALANFAKKNKMTIDQLYLEKGHTQMECDSVHSSLEAYFAPPVFAPSNYIEKMKSARPTQPFSVKVLDYTFFKKFDSMESNFRSIRPGSVVGDPNVVDIRSLLYESTGEVSYKLRHKDNYVILLQPRNQVEDRPIPRLHKGMVKLRKEKYQHLQELKRLLPKEYHEFYNCLPHL